MIKFVNLFFRQHSRFSIKITLSVRTLAFKNSIYIPRHFCSVEVYQSLLSCIECTLCYILLINCGRSKWLTFESRLCINFVCQGRADSVLNPRPCRSSRNCELHAVLTVGAFWARTESFEGRWRGRVIGG